jgi:hypothetical protein
VVGQNGWIRGRAEARRARRRRGLPEDHPGAKVVDNPVPWTAEARHREAPDVRATRPTAGRPVQQPRSVREARHGRFFIDRPIFAWVVALFICLGGALAIPNLPVSQYPVIAPPSRSQILDRLPGSLDPEPLHRRHPAHRGGAERGRQRPDVLRVDERHVRRRSQIIASTSSPGTDPSLAAVDVQNRIKRVEARLPRGGPPAGHPRRGGQHEHPHSSSTLSLQRRSRSTRSASATSPRRNVCRELRRVPGVGRATPVLVREGDCGSGSIRTSCVGARPGAARTSRTRSRRRTPGRLGLARRAAEPEAQRIAVNGAGEGPARPRSPRISARSCCAPTRRLAVRLRDVADSSSAA